MSEDHKEESDSFKTRLSEIFTKARNDFQRVGKDGKKINHLPNSTVAEYFELLSEFYVDNDPEKSKRMKLCSEYATVLINPLANRERWRELMHTIVSDNRLNSEYKITRQNLETAALLNFPQIEDCPISL